MNKHTTHFGYQTVNTEEKAERVAGVFSSVAAQYDLMNDIMSFGMHRLWKRLAIHHLALRPGMHVLDLAGGTADLTLRMAPQILPSGKITLSDINPDMLQHGKARVLDAGFSQHTDCVLADAQALPFPDHHFDRIIIGFGLRNVTDKDLALREMYRVLKVGGQLIVLEFSTPTLRLLRECYDQYSFKLIPLFGRWFANDEASYQYLVESIRRHPGQEELKDRISQAGFDSSEYHNLSAGVVAIHHGVKY